MATPPIPLSVLKARANPRILARFDSAQTTTTNQNLWTGADGLSPTAALSPAVRRVLRQRARYEVANNPYLVGPKVTIANDAVGTGPTLQMETGSAELDSFLESEFGSWMAQVGMGEKLRTGRMSRFESGEVLFVEVTNPSLEHPVKLDIVVVETDQLQDPNTLTYGQDERHDDGIYYDAYGNPQTYRFLKNHPGSQFALSSPWEYQDVSAEFVWHWFRKDRPGQRRGIPEISSCLNTCSELRRFCSAVLDASEWAARASALLKTPAPPDDGTQESPEAMTTADIPRWGAMVLPDGYDAIQMKPEQPVTTYGDFLYKKLGEIGRCINFPLRMMTLDASLANMSASYIDGQGYVRDRTIERGEMERALNRWLDRWLTEALRVPGFIPDELKAVALAVSRYRREWVWPALMHHADPDKVASAESQELKNGTNTLPRMMAAKGMRWEKELATGAKALGLSVEEYQRHIRIATFGPEVEASKPEPSASTATGPTPSTSTETPLPDAGVQTKLALNGAQITSVLEVITQVARKQIDNSVAVELLVAVGIERANAEGMVQNTADSGLIPSLPAAEDRGNQQGGREKDEQQDDESSYDPADEDAEGDEGGRPADTNADSPEVRAGVMKRLGRWLGL